MTTKEMLKDYVNEVANGLAMTDYGKLAEIVETLFEAKSKDLTVYTAGNGGSAATASHICNDLLKGCGVCGHIGYKAECLSDSNAVLTCLANDFDYESVFSFQLRADSSRRSTCRNCRNQCASSHASLRHDGGNGAVCSECITSRLGALSDPLLRMADSSAVRNDFSLSGS